MTNESEFVVVTGASAGIGRATARAFVEQGASVGLAVAALTWVALRHWGTYRIGSE